MGNKRRTCSKQGKRLIHMEPLNRWNGWRHLGASEARGIGSKASWSAPAGYGCKLFTHLQLFFRPHITMQSTMPSSLDWIPNSMASLKESLSLYDTQNPSEDEPQSHSYNVTHQLLARCNTGLNGWKSHIALVKPVGKKSELQQLGIVAQNSAEFRYSSLHGRKLAIAMILGILQFCIHCTSNQYPTKESLPLLPDGVAPLKEFPHVEDGYDKRKLGSWQHHALHMITVETAACKWGDPKQVGAPLSLPSAALPCTSTSMVSTSNRTNTLLAVALQHSKASEFHAVSANFLFAAWGISALLENEQLWQTHVCKTFIPLSIVNLPLSILPL